MKNVKEIVSSYLKANGLDGLYNEIGGCGCGLDDLMPCDSPMDQCEPAIKRICPCCDEDVYTSLVTIKELCQNTDEKKGGGLASLFGIYADKPTSNGVYIPHE